MLAKKSSGYSRHIKFQNWTADGCLPLFSSKSWKALLALISFCVCLDIQMLENPVGEARLEWGGIGCSSEEHRMEWSQQL